MWLAFQSLANNKTPAINGEKKSLPASSSGVRSSAPSGLLLAGNGRAQSQTPSQSPAWQTESLNNPVVMNVTKSTPDYTDPWLDTSSNFWPQDENHFVYAGVIAVCSSIQTESHTKTHSKKAKQIDKKNSTVGEAQKKKRSQAEAHKEKQKKRQ